MAANKTLCDWSKSDIKDQARRLASIVAQADHYCGKCARVANDKDLLCKPKKLPGAPRSGR